MKCSIGALAIKRGHALAVSLDTATSAMPTDTPVEVRDRLVHQLVDAFNELPLNRQVALLQYRWEEIKDPKWLPLLRSMALRYEDYPHLRVTPAFESLQLTAMALTRWYQLDPAGARDAVIAEILRSKPRYNAEVLGLLPDETLQGQEQLLADRFIGTANYEIEGNLASLLFRYASLAVLPQVLKKIDARVGKWACEPQYNALSYVLKVSSETAKPLIERAIAARGPGYNACRHTIFTDIGTLLASPVLEDLAITSLQDSDPEVATNAARYLGEYGSPNAEQPLWERYEVWSHEWAGRESELRFVFSGQNPHVWDANFGQSLARSLARGLGWVSDEVELRRIKALGVGPNIQQDTDAAIRDWLQRPLTITVSMADPPIFRIAQYELHSLAALKTKLVQFAPGTAFTFQDSSRGGSQVAEDKVFQELSEFAKNNGFEMVQTPRSQ
jgi:hypothetical protein